MAGLRVPLSTLRCRPRDRQRMTRGRDGWLGLSRVTLAFTTPRRSPGALSVRQLLPPGRERRLVCSSGRTGLLGVKLRNGGVSPRSRRALARAECHLVALVVLQHALVEDLVEDVLDG